MSYLWTFLFTLCRLEALEAMVLDSINASTQSLLLTIGKLSGAAVQPWGKTN